MEPYTRPATWEDVKAVARALDAAGAAQDQAGQPPEAQMDAAVLRAAITALGKR